VPDGHAAALVLASASPRRAELLGRLGLRPEVVAAEVDERWHPSEPAEHYVARVAAEKVGAVARARPDAVVIGADTAVILDGEPLGKPVDDDHARSMLRRLSGRTHIVLTAVAVARPGGGDAPSVAEDEAVVTMAGLTDAVIEWYVATGEPRDKAGGYALQGAGAVLVQRVEGDPTTVVGLPLRATALLLRAAGLTWP